MRERYSPRRRDSRDQLAIDLAPRRAKGEWHSTDEQQARYLLRKRLAPDPNATIFVNDVFERPEIVEMLSEREARALYSVALKTVRRLRKRLSHR